MFQDFSKDNGCYVEAKGKNLEEIKLMVVREGHELVKVLPDWNVKVSILEIQRSPPGCFRDELPKSIVVGHGKMRGLDELVQAREIYDEARFP